MSLRFFDNISSTKKLLGFFLLSVPCAFLLYYFESKMLVEMIISLAFTGLLVVCKDIWLTEENSKAIQKLLFFLALTLTVSYVGWKDYLLAWVKPILPTYLEKLPITDKISSPMVLMLLLFLIAFFSALVKDNTVMKEHGKSINKDFPERTFKSRLNNYIKRLQLDIESINSDTNWNDFYFTPIEAEVEIISKSNKRKRKVADLLKAIKLDRKSRVFLIIGDPGSGKSTAMRKLAADLLEEVTKTGKIPIYINLKDWAHKRNWTRENPPNQGDIFEFVLHYLKKKKDVFADEFVDEFFKRLYESGRLFFLFDSFDEIPEVLDANEDSWVIDSLSEAFYNFLSGANESRGILASRIFRRPTEKFQTKTTLELRPFSEIKIQVAFSKALSNLKQDFFVNFFRKKLEIFSVARNPFSAALIIQYLKENNFKIPENQIDIYENYIHKRLLKCAELIDEHDLQEKEVIQFAIELSFHIFSSLKSGLEISTNDIYVHFRPLSPSKIDSILSVLSYAKIGRLGADRNFSFVHRRFNEYFVVLKYKENPLLVVKEAIPSDSRMRDAMVLYCELAEEEHAKEIANYCWSEVQKLESLAFKNSEQLLRSIHCLRFLCEAFRHKTDMLIDFRNDLGDHVINTILNGNVLQKKWAVEGIALLELDAMNSAILKSFQTDSPWIQEEALKACRYLTVMSREIHKSIYGYIYDFDVVSLYKRLNDLIFSTSLSESLKEINKIMRWKKAQLILLIFSDLILLMLEPRIFLFLTTLYLQFAFFDVLPTESIRKRLNIKAISTMVMALMVASICWVCFKGFTPGLKLHRRYISFLCALMTFPGVDMYVLLKYNFLKIKKVIDKKEVGWFIGAFGFVALMFAAAFYEKQVPFLRVVWISAAGLFLLIATVAIASLVVSYCKDILFLRKLDVFSLNDRQSVATASGKFATSWGRLRFFNLLMKRNYSPIGDWDDDIMPVFYDRRSNTMLAQLEERWLGLNK